MRHITLILPVLALFCLPSFSQTPVDRTLSLDTIQIQGKRFGGLSGGEVKRMQVDENLSSITVTTADAFRLLPSVITDIEGGITYRGSNHPGLLINGVPYGLMEENSGDMLIQLPASFFNRLSMTSMPSIELIPDGDAGLLNLSSALYRKSDSPLQLNVGAGFQERYNAGAVVNLHPGRFHIVGKYNYRREFRKRTFSKTTTNKSGTTVMNNNATARPDVHLADLNVGYELSANDLISVYGLYYLMDYSRYGKINNGKLASDGSVQPVMFRHRYNDQRQEAYAAEARWNHTFSNPQDQLSVVFNYNNFGYDEGNDYQNEKPETGAIIAEDNYSIHQNKNTYYVSGAFRKMFDEDWSFNAGYIGTFKDEKYNAGGNKKTGGVWGPDIQKENMYQFYRRTNLLYASVVKKWNPFTAEVGVQGELNWQNIKTTLNENTGDKVPYDETTSRFRVYPRAKFAYHMEKGGEFSLSYIQRAIRPYGADLNPFVDQSDATHIRQGNPDLKDEMIHSLELAYLFTNRTFSLSPSLYYRNKSNRIMDVLREDAKGVEIWQKQNIGHSQAFGFELSGTWRPVRLLAIGFAGNVYRDEIDGRSIGYDEKKSMVCADVKGSVNITITPTTELQIDGFYVSDQLTPQGKIKHRSSVNAGLSQYFFQRKLRANVSINNIFNTLEETTIVDTEALKMTQVRNRDAQVTWLTLTYNL